MGIKKIGSETAPLVFGPMTTDANGVSTLPVTYSTSDAVASAISKPWVLSWILPIAPVPGVFGVGPAGDLEWNPKTHSGCVGVGAGASAGKNVSYGPLSFGKMFNGQTYPDGADQILSGWSVSGGGTSPALVGFQGIINSSGVAGGGVVGIPGFSLASTYSWCGKLF